MELSRRDAVRLIGISTAGVFLTSLPSSAAQGQPLPRMPLEEFVQNNNLLAALRRGVREMKRRKPSDPLSWFYQAAIHGVPDEDVRRKAKDDPNVERVFRKRYWNQCPHDGENSANFLPWHRGYTYYFERILRMHAELDEFSLPYWNYTDPKKPGNRKFPKEFGIEHLNGDLNNDADENINPLFMKERDFYFTSYEHPYTTRLPLVQLSDDAVDIELPMNAEVFFGDTEREGLGGGIADENPGTRGLLESYPHDQIHRAVGGVIRAADGNDRVGAMATPPTAGFDPIFPVHHSNIDWLWALWSCKPGKKWGKLPSPYWFNERPWFFFDVDRTVVNEPRKIYFDYRALGIKFKYEDPSCKPLALPDIPDCPPKEALMFARAEFTSRQVETIAQVATEVVATGPQRLVIPIPAATGDRVRNAFGAMRDRVDGRQTSRLAIRLQDVRLGLIEGTGFDVHVTTDPSRELSRSDASFVGSIALFRHVAGTAETTSHESHAISDAMGEEFDISNALQSTESAGMSRLKIVLVPYSLYSTDGKETLLLSPGTLKIGGVEFIATH